MIMTIQISDKIERRWATSGRTRLPIPTLEQRRNLLEQEVVRVAHLGETLAGKAAVLGAGDPGSVVSTFRRQERLAE
jgi:hypothetical protein